MMKLNETTLPFLEVDCIQQFGQEKGKLIFEQAEKIYQELALSLQWSFLRYL